MNRYIYHDIQERSRRRKKRGGTVSKSCCKSLLKGVILVGICVVVAACGGGGNSEDGSDPVFFGNQIDPTKWRFLHFVRTIQEGELVSEIAMHGSNGGNTLSFPGPSTSASTFQVDVTVTESRNNGARVRALIQGRFYKDTAAPGRTGEIIANLDIRQEEDSTDLVVGAFVIRCDDPDCDVVTRLFLDTDTFGSVTETQPHTLSVAFDGATTFTFRFDGQPLVFDQAPAVVAPSENPFGIYGTSVSRIDPAVDPVEEGLIAARFDNLFVNGILLEDFGPNSSVDRESRFVRRVANGVAELERSRVGGTSGSSFVSVPFLDPTQVNMSFQVDVTLTNIVVNGTEGRAFLLSDWYHSGSTIDGRTGNVISTFGINHDGTNTTFEAFVSQCNNSDCSESTILFFEDNIFGPAVVGETHTLSKAFDGTNITFGVNDQLPESFNPTISLPVNGPAQEPFTAFRVFVFRFDSPQDEAFITARFDNVLVNGEPFDDFSPLVDAVQPGPMQGGPTAPPDPGTGDMPAEDGGPV